MINLIRYILTFEGSSLTARLGAHTRTSGFAALDGYGHNALRTKRASHNSSPSCSMTTWQRTVIMPMASLRVRDTKWHETTCHFGSLLSESSTHVWGLLSSQRSQGATFGDLRPLYRLLCRASECAFYRLTTTARTHTRNARARTR